MARTWTIEKLADPDAWRTSPVADDVMVTAIRTADVRHLARAGDARYRVEAFLETELVIRPSVRCAIIG